MSNQSDAQWIVAFTMKDERQFRYIVRDGNAARELISAVAREAQVGRPIAIFFYGLEQENTGAIQVDEIMFAISFQEKVT